MKIHEVKCPSCGTGINIDEVIKNRLEESLRKEFQEKYIQDINLLNEEKSKIETERKKLEEFKANEKEYFQRELLKEVTKKVEEKETQLKLSLQDTINSLQKKVYEGDQEKIKNQQLEIQLKNQADEIRRKYDLEISKKELELRNQLSEQIKKEEQEKSEIKLKEYEVRIEQMKKQADEMQRKASQGSMEVQGEALEKWLDEELRRTFPHDEVTEIKKGEIGADLILSVKSERLGYCGSVVYECKNAKNWSNDWIEKLRSDMKLKNAQVGILVTKSFPKGYDRFTNIGGVWVCSANEVLSITEIMRSQLKRLKEIEISQHDKGDKSLKLYDYLQSETFQNAMQEIAQSFITMKSDIVRERSAMEKHWKLREHQLEALISNTISVSTKIQSIGGNAMIELPGFEI